MTFQHTATYSPEDNKLRIYPAHRLDPEEYARVKSHGFIWAGAQKLFVAPGWSPSREDFLIEFCGEIGDEDKSLVERQEERADRFTDYSESRKEDATRAQNAVSAIADNIPLGQPILVGHHSERHARRDAERIENGMRKAVRLWETASYWKDRAKGALHHAKYKERPDVRARRIKKLEAEQRARIRSKAEFETALEFWSRSGLNWELARKMCGASTCRALNIHLPRKEGDKPDFNQCPDAYSCLSGENGENYYPSLYAPRTLEEIIEVALRRLPLWAAYEQRWIDHYENRLTYEKTMLDEQGASNLIAAKPRPKQLPILNYRAPEGITLARLHSWEKTRETVPQVELTSAEYSKIYEDNRGTRTVDNSHRVKVALLSMRKYPQLRTPADDEHAKRYGENCVTDRKLAAIFLTDKPTHEKPEPIQPPPPPERPTPTYTPFAPSEEEIAAEKLKDLLKLGVQVAVAPQLFPTPKELAERMVDEANIIDGSRVLEPSAGTGNIAAAISTRARACVLCVEINPALAAGLERMGYPTECADFLQCNGNLGTFDRIIMNPPFVNGEDIKHIEYALTFLRVGGRLVALCANGPRQNEKLKPRASYWEVLPANTFKESGTGVNVALLIIEGGA